MTERLTVLRTFVGGEYVDSADGATSEVVDPATGEAYARAPVSGSVDVDVGLRGGRHRLRDMARRNPGRAAAGSAQVGRRGRGAMYGFEEYTRVKHVMSYFGELASRTGKLSGQ